MKSAVILVAIAGLASASTPAPYKALSNPGTGKCIVAGAYDAKRDEYKLGLGSCSDGVEFAFQGNGKFLQTSDGYCLSSHANSGGKGNPVVLAACKSGKPGKQWTALSGTEQWKNGYKLCLDYDSKAKTMVQASCQSAPLPMGSMQQYAFCGSAPVPPAPRPPTPPPARPVTCSQWSASWICPKGYSLVSNPKYVTCDGSTQNCVNNCCVYTPPPPPPTTQKCGTWSVKNGGPINSCGAGYTYTARDWDVCAANGADCRARCCSPVPQTQLCGTWSVKNGGPINSCGAGYTYTAGDRDTCAANGANCKAVCCSPAPQTQKCGTWSVKNGGPINSCGNGFTYTAGDNDTCALDSSNCQAKCCSAVTPQLCTSWSLQNGGPNNSCGDGFTFTAGPSDTCNSNGSNCANVCCGPLQN